VPQLLKSHDVVLIKWQYVDSKANRLLRLKQELPEACHKIILLQVSFEEIAERLPSKKLWRHYGQELIYATKEISLVQESLDVLKDSFGVTTVDGGKSGHYKILNIAAEELPPHQ
jgi:hypothetical protein